MATKADQVAMTKSDTATASAARSREGGLLYPLDLVYERAGIAVPRVEVVQPDGIPLPYRSLLAHDVDMTLTLERHLGRRVVKDDTGNGHG